METKLITITPEMASALLSKNNHNRSVNIKRVSLYAEEMKAGRWHTTHQGVAIFRNGHIADGQHRLLACVASGIPMTVLLTTDIPFDSALGIDDHKPRMIGDIIKISTDDGWFSKSNIAIIRQLICLTGNRQKISAEQMINIATDAVRERIDFIDEQFKYRNKQAKGIRTAPVLAALTTAVKIESYKNIERFCDILITGLVEKKQDSTVIKLRDYVLTTSYRNDEDRRNSFLKTQKAISQFCANFTLYRLVTPRDFIYPLYL